MSFTSGNQDEATKTRRRQLTGQNKPNQTNFVSFQEFFYEGELSPASYFKEMDKTKIDLHNIMDNFYKKKFHIETIVSYVKLYTWSEFEYQLSSGFYCHILKAHPLPKYMILSKLINHDGGLHDFL